MSKEGKGDSKEGEERGEEEEGGSRHFTFLLWTTLTGGSLYRVSFESP